MKTQTLNQKHFMNHVETGAVFPFAMAGVAWLFIQLGIGTLNEFVRYITPYMGLLSALIGIVVGVYRFLHIRRKRKAFYNSIVARADDHASEIESLKAENVALKQQIDKFLNA